MPKNPDLVPTVIVDVNGRTTIVHKLRKLFSSSGSRSSGSRIPAPVTTTPKSVVMNELMKSLPDAAGLTDKTTIEDLRRGLNDNYPLGTLRYIRAIMERGDDFSVSVAKHLAQQDFPADGSAKVHGDHIEVTLRNNVMFSQILGIDDYDEVNGLVRGTQNMNSDLIEMRNLLYLGEPEIKQFAAVAKATRALRDQYPLSLSDANHPVREYQYGEATTWSLNSRDLYALLMERPESMDEIVEVVVKHQTTERYRIWGLMLDAEGPMAEGAL
jgi:hypothetical protein